MSIYANEVLDEPLDEDFDYDPEPEPEDNGDAVESQYAAHMNPLALVASDLVSVGWESDPLGENWTHEDHGQVSFMDATRIEANKLGSTFPENF